MAHPFDPDSERTGVLSSPETFRQVYERTYLQLYRYAFVVLAGHSADAEDVVADAFTRAWQARDHFMGSLDEVPIWLLRITRNRVIDFLRSRRRRGAEHAVDAAPLIDPARGPAEQALMTDDVARLVRLLQRLPPDDRDVLLLRYVLGWPVQRVASYLNCSPNAASVRVRRALERLRRDWFASGGESHL